MMPRMLVAFSVAVLVGVAEARAELLRVDLTIFGMD